MSEAELVETKDGLFIEVDGVTELMCDQDGNWRGKEPGWTVSPTTLFGPDGQVWKGFAFQRDGEPLDWVFYYHEGKPGICRITETRRMS